MLDFLIIPAQLNRLNTLKDGTISIVFETQEMTPENIGQLYGLRMKLCYVAIKPETFSPKEKDILSDLEADVHDQNKTPSKRLRNVLFRTWEKRPEGYTDFNLYYLAKMEKIINVMKSKID